MSDIEAQEEAELETEGGRSPLRIILVVIIVLAVLGGGGWWAYNYFETQKAEQARAAAQAAAMAKAAQEAQRAEEDSKMMANLQREKQVADDALKRAQEDRDRAAQELEAAQKSQKKGAKRSSK